MKYAKTVLRKAFPRSRNVFQCMFCALIANVYEFRKLKIALISNINPESKVYLNG